MIVTHKIKMDLSARGVTQRVDAVQDDKYSRNLEFTLLSNGEPWEIPSGTTAVVRYRKPDGTGGNYDVLPDDSPAYQINGNVLTVALAPQICTVEGLVLLAVGLISGSAEINTFTVNIVVQPNPGAAYQSEDYIKLAGAVPNSGWTPNMYLGTDESGNVVAKEGNGGGGTGADGGYYTPSVDDEGNLTWTASKESMPAVDGANIMGPQGEPGKDASRTWSGKTLAAFGTSITYLCSNYSGGYLERIKELCGFSGYTNLGVSGAPMTNNTANGNGINYKIKNTAITADAVMIECCTNDFKLNVPVGTLETTNVYTFSGALKDALDHLLTNYPSVPIILVADPQRDNDGYDVDYVNSAGCRLIDYINMAILTGSRYGIPVCDLYRNSGITAGNLDTYTVDGLHPNAAGYARMGESVSGVLNSMHGSVLEAPQAETEIRLDGEYYDISAAAGCQYKMAMKINDTYYLYQSHYPIWIYQDGDSYSEVVARTMTSRLSADSTKIFGNAVEIQSAGVEALDGTFSRFKESRTADQFLWANHDVYLWGTNTKMLRKGTVDSSADALIGGSY